jgi:hypothetical protein
LIAVKSAILVHRITGQVKLYSLTKAHPVALLPENKLVANSDMPKNLNAVGYVKK